MPPDRGRAGKACSACRKQKTRCYAGERPGAGCLRCTTLRQVCSFTTETGAEDSPTAIGEGNHAATDTRLDRLESAVNLLLERLGEGNTKASQTRSPTPNRIAQQSPAGRSRGASLEEDAVAPVFVLRDLAAETGNGSRSNGQRHPSQIDPGYEDIISVGLISQSDATLLVSIFQEHYGRWVAFDSAMPPEVLLQTIRRSPLLLSACCLIAVRHFSVDIAGSLAPSLFETTKALLSSALLVNPQQLEFFQAVVVLCMWSTTVGQNPLSIDSWLVSGFALQHCFSTKIFQPIVGSSSSRQSRLFLDKLRIFNHLCLVHLHYCCGTRRRSIIGRHQIDKCREILNSDHATNFEQRMVAEVNLYWIIYENCIGSTLDLPKVQASLHDWKKKWGFVLDQPRSQFLEMGHHFAQLLAYERALKTRSAHVRDSLLNEMVRLSVSIMNLAMDNADERTPHLSDHIYHIKTFAAVTLCRLLNLYETQLAISHSIAELDNLIIRFIDWLKSLGQSSHSGHILGLTVAAFHRKLRPNAQPPPQPVMELPTNDWVVESFIPNFLPDLLDTEVSPGGNWEWHADWEPFTTGPLS